MILTGDCRAVLPTLDAASVNCCISSPPYFGLRDYGHDGQIGLEATPDAYVAQLVAVFREVRRVLADDGTLWLNIGDTYSAGKPRLDADCRSGGLRWANRQSFRRDRRPREDDPHKSVAGLAPKNIIGIPWRVAFALQADGWYLRSDIIWHKPNAMPESVSDRPSKAHEYLFLLSKSRKYYYDADAIAEPCSAAMLEQIEQGYDGLGLKDYESAGVQNPSSVKARIIANARGKALTSPRNDGNTWNENNGRGFIPTSVTRNKRTVWTIATQPFPGSHFAVMPEALVEPCIRAGSREGGLILDPFAGAGTVGVVAAKLQRRFIGIELNRAYVTLVEQRIAAVAPLFAAEPVA